MKNHSDSQIYQCKITLAVLQVTAKSSTQFRRSLNQRLPLAGCSLSRSTVQSESLTGQERGQSGHKSSANGRLYAQQDRSDVLMDQEYVFLPRRFVQNKHIVPVCETSATGRFCPWQDGSVILLNQELVFTPTQPLEVCNTLNLTKNHLRSMILTYAQYHSLAFTSNR